MRPRKENWQRTGVSMSQRQLEYLSKFPCDRSAALALCVEYAAKTGFLETVAGVLPPPSHQEQIDLFAGLDEQE